MPDSGTLWRGQGPKLFDRAPARVALALLIGVLGAIAARMVAMPLPYLLGPLLTCAGASILSAPISPVPYGRELGQVAVGLAIGLRFIPTVVIAIIAMLPFMLAATILMIIATMIAAFMISKLAALDLRTSFFATAAAGLAEMAVVAHQKGADSDTVAVVHLIRVTSIVTVVPFLVTIFGEDGGITTVPIPFRAEAMPLVALYILAAVAGYLASPWKIPNTWLLVPALVGGLVAGFGFGPFAVPSTVLVIAQVVIGIWLGCRFRRSLLGRLSRVTFSAFATTAFLLAVAMGLAWLLSAATGLSFVTSLLAVAPAGVTEMVLTATAMHLDTTTVTAFQITRIAVVMTTILISFRIFEHLARRFGAASE
ncbi:AbrB family transcriptional regulator [Phyllobacterium sp. BT25]|uniref:AbrB family transcriptional regulator n=1 Tax=Phyllobacterium pellucidum TaxID=2740464 RepID=A0A849VTL5_9HYPH|nr:AbrB family transcriptional regulator [Phyllobacterium pellucidum]NTS33305.1 AbrB family transcriptional regulator [Phyllobacterium pellucidum]